MYWSGVDLQLLDENGATAEVELQGYGKLPALFQYLPAEYASEETPEGWYFVDPDDEDGNPLWDYPQNLRKIEAGQSFLMNCQQDDAVVTIPSAL